MTDLTCITIALLLSFIGGGVAVRLKYSRVIGQLIIGLVLGVPLLKNNFSSSSKEIMGIFSEMGIIFLLLLTGFEVDPKNLRKEGKNAAVISIAGAVILFILGFLVGYFIIPGIGFKGAFVIGACMTVTAEGTTVAILIELKKINSKVGSIIVGAGIIDDIFEIIFLTILLFLSKGKMDLDYYNIGKSLTLILLFISLAIFFIPKIIRSFIKQKNEISLFSSMIVIGLSLAVMTDILGLSVILGAFIAGLILQKSFFKNDLAEEESKNLELFVFSFIIPFFFAYVGLNFDYQGLISNPFLTIVVLLVAIAGKIIGTLIAKPFTDLSLRQLHLIGWGMNSRGIMELVIAHIALKAELINSEIYSIIVFMAITTTLIFPFILKYMIKEYPKIMD